MMRRPPANPTGKPPLRIGIWGHYHGRNLGDDVVVAALIQNIRVRRPDACIFGISLDPADTWSRHGVPAFSMLTGEPHGAKEADEGEPGRRAGKRGPPRWATVAAARVSDSRWRIVAKLGRLGMVLEHALASYRHLAPVDLVLVAGSGPVSDTWSGPWAHPYRMLRWAGLTRLAGGTFNIVSAGEGPVNASLSRLFLGIALQLSSYRSFRDPQSMDTALAVGVPRPSYVFPDLGFSLNEPEVGDARQRTDREEPGDAGSRTVGLSTMAHRDPRYFPRGSEAHYRAYLDKLTGLSDWLLDQGYQVLLLRAHVHADERVARDLVQALMARRSFTLGEDVRMAPTETHQDLIAQTATCDIVVGGRFHCHVLSFLLHKPVLGLAYHPKTVELMEYMGQSRYCLDLDRASVGEMIERFQELEARRAEVHRELAWRVVACRRALALQYDVLLGDRPPADLRGRTVHLPGHPGYMEPGLGSEGAR